MTTTERTAIATPASGLQVYDTTTNTQWYYNGTAWVEGASTAIGSKWTNDATNSLVKLTSLSDGSTVRPTGNEFVIKDNSLIGIGTSSPTNSIHIKKDWASLMFENNSGSHSTTMQMDPNSGICFNIYRGGINNKFYNYYDPNLDIYSFPAVNKVGIGMLVPSAALDIISLGTDSSTKALKIVNSASTPSEILTVLDNGSVGIGVPSPTATLSVHRGSDNGGYGVVADFYSYFGDIRGVISADGVGTLRFGTVTSHTVTFITSGVDMMNINTSGVGIGTGTAHATSKLQVVGLPVHADNATATAAGLTAGAFYHNGDGVVRVVF